MTPSALSGGAATASTGAGGGAPRSSSSGSDSGKDFNALLQGKPEQSSKTAASKESTSNSASKPTRPDSAADTHGRETPPRTATGDASDTAAETPATGATPVASSDPQPAVDDPTVAPWPPSGLAGLVLSTLLPDTTAATDPAVSSPASGTASAPLPALPATALSAGNQAPVTAQPGVALPAAALLNEGDAVPDPMQAAVAAALEAAGLGGDDAGDAATATPVLLHGVQASAEVRGPMAAATVFAGEPTPTPSLDSGDFDQAIGARIGWLADQKIGHAHIRVSPDDMGTVEVRLQLDGDKVHASFSSPHVDVRQALESSLPRLRELLGEQGFQLAHADVGQQGQGPQDGSAGGSGLTGGGDGEPVHETVVSAAQLMRHRGLLDTYA